MRFLPRLRRHEVVQPSPPSSELSPRIERALMALAVHAQQLDDRMAKIEDQLVDTSERVDHLPTHADVLAVRIHSAQVMTELAAVSMELRDEIARSQKASNSNHDPRVITMAEQVIDLSDSVDTNLEDIRRVEPMSFIRPDVGDYVSDDPDAISWGPAPETSHRSA